MGTVWAATDEVLLRRVAIKEIKYPPGTPAAEVTHLQHRLLREARAVAALSHPNVITVYDVLTTESGPMIVMELLAVPTADRHRPPAGQTQPPAHRSDRSRGRLRPDNGTRPGHHPPRRQTRQRPDHRRRAGHAHRFRDRPEHRRPHHHRHRPDPRLPRLHRPGDRPRPADRPGVRRVELGRPAVLLPGRTTPVRPGDRDRDPLLGGQGPGPAPPPRRRPRQLGLRSADQNPDPADDHRPGPDHHETCCRRPRPTTPGRHGLEPRPRTRDAEATQTMPAPPLPCPDRQRPDRARNLCCCFPRPAPAGRAPGTTRSDGPTQARTARHRHAIASYPIGVSDRFIWRTLVALNRRFSNTCAWRCEQPVASLQVDWP